jgi:hypothetical protein
MAIARENQQSSRSGARPLVLKPKLLAKLKLRLREPPPAGGVRMSDKVAGWLPKTSSGDNFGIDQ